MYWQGCSFSKFRDMCDLINVLGTHETNYKALFTLKGTIVDKELLVP